MLIPRSVTVRTWKNLFRFCIGLAAGAAFCMKWMESDLVINKQLFTILGLELFYPREKVIAVLVGLDNKVATILNYHLSFDFAFMAGVYPGITALCMMAREKTSSATTRKIFFVLASLQIVAWGADIAENSYLYYWLSFNDSFNPVEHLRSGIHMEDVVTPTRFVIYHAVVIIKWVLALAGLLWAIPYLLRKRKPGF